jgi:hypothetical protein
MERAVEIFAAVQCLVIALSHIFQPRAWVEFFVWLRSKGHAGVFANGFLILWFGGLIVAFHNVWEGLPIVLTLLGWGQVIKATIAFVAPQLSMRGLQRVSPGRSYEFVYAGVFLLGLSGILGTSSSHHDRHLPRGYSIRSATVGSTPSARRVGTTQARRQTASMRAA